MIELATGVLTNLGTPDRSTGSGVRTAESLEACVAGADLVVETVPEKLDIKLKVFGEIDKAVSKSCIIASNTSGIRSEEHTSELQSLMRSSYAVFCLKRTNSI